MKSEVKQVLLDTADLLILTLISNHKFIRAETVSRFGFGIKAGIDALLKLGFLVPFGRKREYLRLGPEAECVVKECGIEQSGRKKYAYDAPQPSRFSRYAEISMTCLRAGIDSASNSIDAMTAPPAFVTSLPLRDGKERHLVSTAQCAGFGRWRDTLYMFFYLSQDSKAIRMQYEFSLLHSIGPLFGAPLDTPGIFVLAGESYESAYNVLRQPQEQKPNGAVSFSKAFAETTIPVELLSCDETGAMQLAITRQPNYKTRLLNAVVGAGIWKPPDKGLDADALVDDIPLILAVDMNIKRVSASIAAAKARGYEQVYVAALQGQVEKFWQRHLPKQGVELFAFPFEAVSLGDMLYTPDRKPAAPGGRWIYV